MRSFTESIGAHLIVAILPGRRQMTVSYRPGERQQDVTIELLEGLRIPYVDLYPVLKDAVSHDPETRWFWDELHFYKAGHRLVGEHLAAVLVKTFPDLF
jgi:lysophospholipase L1-like esterase